MARPPLQAERQSRSPGKPRPMRVAAKCGACFVALLGIVAQATTFVASLALIRILPATQPAWDLFRGSLGCRAVSGHRSHEPFLRNVFEVGRLVDVHEGGEFRPPQARAHKL